MTNYNERLDEILTKLENAVALNIGSQGMRGEAPKHSHWKSKQAITSLTKELVVEAKPTRSETQIGNLIIYGDLSKRDLNIIDQFEQNLLKALEEKI